MSETVERFQFFDKPWPGGGVELHVALNWWFKESEIPMLSAGCVSEGEWRGAIQDLIDDLRLLEKKGLKKRRAAKARGPQAITED